MGQSGSPLQSNLDGKINWDKGRGILDLESGNKSISPSATGDDTINLQTAINTISEDGGGTLLLKSGTYTVSSDITLKSSVALKGDKESTTIIDFNSNDAGFIATGTDVYTTGTISSIAMGVVVTGSSTSWLANVTTDMQFFIAGTWYRIASVDTDTQITLAEGYNGGATFPSAYRIATVIKDIGFEELTVKDSTDSAFDFTDVRDPTLDKLRIQDSNKNVELNNVSELTMKFIVATGASTDSIKMTACALFLLDHVVCATASTDGFALTSCRLGQLVYTGAFSNGDHGYDLSTVNEVDFVIASKNNSNAGLNMAGSDSNTFRGGYFESNANDGIQLQTACDRNIITAATFKSNGAYGVDVAAASCDKNLIHGNQFISNSSGTINDSGTGTSSVDNVT